LKDESESDEDFDIKFYNQMESISKENKNKLLESPTDQFI
jgi:hypothetical protein